MRRYWTPEEEELFDRYDNHTIAYMTGRTVVSVEQHRHVLKIKAAETWGRLCPVCGKRFDPPDADTWVYKTGKERRRLVCSWKCMRKVEHDQRGKEKDT